MSIYKLNQTHASSNNARYYCGGPGEIRTVFGARIGYKNYVGSCLGRSDLANMRFIHNQRF